MFLSLAFFVMSTASAVTITVAQGGGADQTTILGALGAANSGDVIQINDSATYSEALPYPINTGAGGAILNSLTIQVAAGMTPTIENMTGNGFDFGPNSATTTVTGPFVIQGASNTARLTLRPSTGAIILSAGQNNTAPPNGSHHAITVSNVKLVRVLPSINQVIFMRNTDGPVTLTNVSLHGGNLTTAANMVVWGWPGGPNVFTATNLDTSAFQAADACYRLVFFGGQAVLNDCNITGLQDGSQTNEILNAGNATLGGSITFNNCTLIPGIHTGQLVRRISVASLGANETYNNCTFGMAGEVAFRMRNGQTTTIAGTPTAKTDMSPLMNPLNTPPTLVAFSIEGPKGGNFIMRDVVISDTWATAQDFRDWNASNTGTNTITIDRCFFKNWAMGNGCFWSNCTLGTIYNVSNSIFMGVRPDWTGTPGPAGTGYFFLQTAGKASLNLVHSTFIGGVPTGVNLTFFRNNLGAAQGNLINANYCIFDDRILGTGICSNTHLSLSGRVSLVSCSTFNPTTGIPADWIVGTVSNPLDPKINLTNGRLTDLTSPAVGAGQGSFSAGMIDIDGNMRPLDRKDLGASQTPYPNAASGWAEFK